MISIINDKATAETVSIFDENFGNKKHGLRIAGNYKYVRIANSTFMSGKEAGLRIVYLQKGDDILVPETIEIDNSYIFANLGEAYPIKISAAVVDNNGEERTVNIDHPIKRLIMRNVKVRGMSTPFIRGRLDSGSPDQFSIQNVEHVELENCESHYGGENGFSITMGCKTVSLSHCVAAYNDGQGFHIGTHDVGTTNMETKSLYMGDCRSVNNFRNVLGSNGKGCGVLLHNVNNSQFDCHLSYGHEIGISNIHRTDKPAFMSISSNSQLEPFIASKNVLVS